MVFKHNYIYSAICIKWMVFFSFMGRFHFNYVLTAEPPSSSVVQLDSNPLLQVNSARFPKLILSCFDLTFKERMSCLSANSDFCVAVFLSQPHYTVMRCIESTSWQFLLCIFTPFSFTFNLCALSSD